VVAFECTTLHYRYIIISFFVIEIPKCPSNGWLLEFREPLNSPNSFYQLNGILQTVLQNARYSIQIYLQHAIFPPTYFLFLYSNERFRTEIDTAVLCTGTVLPHI